MARLLAARGKRVLVSSYTHGAVDNLLLKLMKSGVGRRGSGGSREEEPNADLVRIGPKSACHPNVHSILAPQIACRPHRNKSADGDGIGSTTTNNSNTNNNTTTTNNNNNNNNTKPSTQSLHRVMCAAKIVGVSALTIPRSPLLIGQHFDYVIVDEAGQISQPAIVGALMAADSFILVGDHEQLPPLVTSASAEEAGACVWYIVYYTTIHLVLNHCSFALALTLTTQVMAFPC